MIFVLVIIHVVILYMLPEMLFPEIVFPTWMLSITNNFVSEDHFLHPPLLYYLVSTLARFTGDLRLSLYLLHILTVVIVDSILYLYLQKLFGRGYAVLGFLFYLPWQIFFRGNSLWFDYATIPFLAISFFNFSKFITTLKLKSLIWASVFLSFGYFFKQTIFWFFLVYLIFSFFNIRAIFLKYNYRGIFKVLTYLIIPPILAIVINTLISFVVSNNFLFSLEWSLIIPLFVHARLPMVFRLMSISFLKVIITLLTFYLISIVILKKDKFFLKQNALLAVITLVSIANIFPSWGDFRMQPFVFFLTILLTSAIYKILTLHYRNVRFYLASLIILTLVSFAIFANRIRIEYLSRDATKVDLIAVTALSNYSKLFKNKTVFAYDTPQFHGDPKNWPNITIVEKIYLIVFDPETYYRVTSPNISQNYVTNQKPEYLLITNYTQDRINSGYNLVPFETYIQNNYINVMQMNNAYWIYKIRN